MEVMKWFEQIKFKYSPSIPSVDYNNFESRRNWILFMSKKTGKFPVREIYDTMDGHVSKMTINNDLKALEEENVIKREKDNKTGKSYVIPLFEDSGIAIPSSQEKRKNLFLNYGLPLISIILFGILITISLIK